MKTLESSVSKETLETSTLLKLPVPGRCWAGFLGCVDTVLWDDLDMEFLWCHDLGKLGSMAVNINTIRLNLL